jgi:hypothetical protein
MATRIKVDTTEEFVKLDISVDAKSESCFFSNEEL